MKRILTLSSCLLTALAMQAQNFFFQYQGQKLADGETVIISAEEDLFGDLSCETNNLLNPDDGLVLMSLNAMAVTVSATMQISHNTLDAEMLQWCMGGQCTPFNNQTSLTKKFKVTGSEQVQFDAIGIGSEGYLQAMLKVSIGLETHSVNIMFANGDIDAIASPAECKKSGEAFYDLRGKRVQGRPMPGIYVKVEGESCRKVVVR